MAQIAQRIARSQQLLLNTNIRQRKVTGLFTLYSIIIYIIYATVLFINYSSNLASITVYHGSTIILFPVLIYGIRRLLTFYFTRLISARTERIKVLKEEQKEKIEDLKQSTNFYSTKALLERFDSSFPQQEKKSQQQQRGNKSSSSTATSTSSTDPVSLNQQNQAVLRNRNAKGNNQNQSSSTKKTSMGVAENFEFAPDLPSLQQKQTQNAQPGQANTQLTAQQLDHQVAAGFPGQPPFSSSSSLAPVHNTAYQPHWYDRILDMIVGEDEYSPKSRYALICESCRNHNGLAQPGELPQYVVYICPHCGHRNGIENTKKRTKHQSSSAGGEDGQKPLKFDTSSVLTNQDDSENSSSDDGAEINDKHKEQAKGVEKPNKHKRHHSIADGAEKEDKEGDNDEDEENDDSKAEVILESISGSNASGETKNNRHIATAPRRRKGKK